MHKLHVNNALLSLISEIHYKEFHGSLLDTLGMRQEIFEFIANNSSSGLVCLDVINKFDKLKKPRWIPLRRLCRRLGIFEFVLKINDILRYGSNSGLLCSTRTR